MIQIYRSEYPRPDFKRSQWRTLNGFWMFTFDDTDAPSRILGRGYDRQIHVPFCYQSEKSGIGQTSYYEAMWYARRFIIREEELAGSILLKFGAVDSDCRIYVNGSYVGEHHGGYTQFEFDIRNYVQPGENLVAVYVRDDRSCAKPRGKQYWKDTPDRCWYTESSGIWKPVWLEFTGSRYITAFRCLPDMDRRQVVLDVELNRCFCGKLELAVYWDGQLRRQITTAIDNCSSIHEVIGLPEEDFVDEVHFWSPEHPNLYTLSMTISSGDEVCDRVESYFGMRQVQVEGRCISLNRQPLYQRLILDQGYWPESLTTPPDEEAIIRDLTLIKELGFNGVRMHQKNEDPLFYYHADRLGLLVWLEMPSAYQFTPSSVHRVLQQWESIVRENWNHPSIIAYVPFNESWGVRDIVVDPMQQAAASSAYYLTKALDPTRLISTNDGWEFSDNTDFYGIHSYFSSPEIFNKQFSNWEARYAAGMVNRPLKISCAQLEEKPVMLTEFGGIALQQDMSGDAWGYNDAAASSDLYEMRLRRQVEAVLENPLFCGYCYTQLTDVMQEINGVMNADREGKLPLEVYRTIFGKNPPAYQH